MGIDLSGNRIDPAQHDVRRKGSRASVDNDQVAIQCRVWTISETGWIQALEKVEVIAKTIRLPHKFTWVLGDIELGHQLRCYNASSPAYL